MKTLYFFLAILLCMSVTSCSLHDDTNDQQPVSITWNLTRVTGSIAGVDQTIPSGRITWVFNEETHMLVVVNNNTDDTIFDFYDSGTYAYSVESNGSDNILTISNTEFGAFTVTQNQLKIDQQVDDGFVLTFTR